MPWATIEQVRAISGITKEQITDGRLAEIIKEADIRLRRMALDEYIHFKPAGTVIIGDKIQLPEDFLVADGNFDGRIDKDDIKIYGCQVINGFLRKIELTITSFEPKDGIITLANPIPVEYLGLWIECWLNTRGLTKEELSTASSLLAAAMCCRQIYGKEGFEMAREYEEKAKEIIRKSLAIFI